MKKLLVALLIAAGIHQALTSGGGDGLDRLMERSEKTSRAGMEVVRTAGGPDFDVAQLAEPGAITVVEFYTEVCPACKKLRREYGKFLPLRPDVAVRRVWLPNRWSPVKVRERFGVNAMSTPHVIIYDAEGEVVGADEGTDKSAYELLYDWMNAEHRKDWEQRSS